MEVKYFRMFMKELLKDNINFLTSRTKMKVKKYFGIFFLEIDFLFLTNSEEIKIQVKRNNKNNYIIYYPIL